MGLSTIMNKLPVVIRSVNPRAILVFSDTFPYSMHALIDSLVVIGSFGDFLVIAIVIELPTTVFGVKCRNSSAGR